MAAKNGKIGQRASNMCMLLGGSSPSKRRERHGGSTAPGCSTSCA
jgi:hypothetical protein